MEQFQINLLGIVIALVYNFIIGSLWYSPLLFGERWSKLVGMREDDLQGGMTPSILLGALAVALAEAFGFALLQNFTGFSGFFGGLFLGVFVWLLFVVPTFFNQVLYAKKPRALFLIEVGNNLVTFAGMSLIIGLI